MMPVRERWVRYCMKMQCIICGEDIFNWREDAEVDNILATNDFGTPSPLIDFLREALSWSEHEGRYCDYHTHVMGKDD
jgi:hypothetical protein